MKRVLWWLLVGILLALIFVAWTGVDNAQLRAWAIEGAMR